MFCESNTSKQQQQQRFRRMNSQTDITKPLPYSLSDSATEEQRPVDAEGDEYLQERLSHLLQLESLTHTGRDYMALQYELSPEMRYSLLAYLVKAHFAFQLCPETLFLAVRLLDSVLSIELVQGEELLLLGLACLLIASKMEDTQPVSPPELAACASDYCSLENILAAERNVMRLIDDSPSRHVSSLAFYEFMTLTHATHSDCHFMARYFLELQLFDLTAANQTRPSLQAAAAISLAMDYTHGDTCWHPEGEFQISRDELLACRTHLESVYVTAMETKNHPIRLKFSSSAFQGVALSRSQAV